MDVFIFIEDAENKKLKIKTYDIKEYVSLGLGWNAMHKWMNE